MTLEEQEIFRQNIEDEIIKIEKSLGGLTEGSRPVEPDNAIGRLSRMEAISAKAVSENALANTKNRLSKLKVALTKLNDPEFGLCAECGEAIPHKRLLLVPESIMCVKCAER